MHVGIFQVFVALPTSLSCTVLGNWLDLKSICRLDSALCEKLKRAAFICLVQSIECVKTFDGWQRNRLEWLNIRSIRTSTLVLTDNLPGDVLEDYLRRFGHHVRNLRLNMRFGGSLLSIVAQNCHNLDCYHSVALYSDGVECYDLIRANPNLVELRVYCEDKVTSIEGIVLHTLQYLCLCDGGFDDRIYVALIRQTRRLLYLSLLSTTITSSGMIEAAQYCPHLMYVRPPDILDIDYALLHMTKVCVYIQHLDLSRCKSISDVGLSAVAKHVIGLRSIHFEYSTLITNRCLHYLAEHQHHTLEVFSVDEVCNGRNGVPLSVEPLTENSETFNTAAVTLFRNKCLRLRVCDWQRWIACDQQSDESRTVSYVSSADRVTTLLLFYASDAILATVAARCKQLEMLDIANCTTVNTCSDAILLQVAEQCATLRGVNVESTQVNRLQQLYAVYPHIQVYSSSCSVYSYNLHLIYRDDHKNEYP